MFIGFDPGHTSTCSTSPTPFDQAAAEKHLSGICEWSVPAGGMFMWIRALHVPDTWDMIMKRALDANVMLVPGKAFMVDQVGHGEL